MMGIAPSKFACVRWFFLESVSICRDVGFQFIQLKLAIGPEFCKSNYRQLSIFKSKIDLQSTEESTISHWICLVDCKQIKIFDMQAKTEKRREIESERERKSVLNEWKREKRATMQITSVYSLTHSVKNTFCNYIENSFELISCSMQIRSKKQT